MRAIDKRQLNERYAEIAQELIDTEEILVDIRNSQATIVYLSSEHKKMDSGKVVHAVCEKVAEKYKWGIPADFTITVFEPNVVGMTEEQIRILLFHELLHVGIDFADGEEKYSIIPHDLEDFKYIIDRFGTSWSAVKKDNVLDFGKSDICNLDLKEQIENNLSHM